MGMIRLMRYIILSFDLREKMNTIMILLSLSTNFDRDI